MIKSEMLNVIDAVAREKGIDYEEVLTAVEHAIEKAARAKYGREHDIRASIDRKSGEIELQLCHTVVEEVVDPFTELTLEEARQREATAALGDVLSESLPPIDFGRVAAQTAKQVIYTKVREAERLHQYEEYKPRVGTIVSGVVKRVEFGNVIVELGQAEAILRRDEMIPRENFRPGERLRALLLDARHELRGPQLFLSRTHPTFMAKLFEQEVPEIYDGLIEIKSVARDPGSRAKIAVASTDSSLDPVGSCVGMRGSRVQAVVNELQGEKVDIVPWSTETATFVVNALAPAEVSKVVVDEENNRIEVVVPEDSLSVAIGRRGQNVKLASILTGLVIDVLTEDQAEERRAAELKQLSQTFMESLDVDEVITHLLLSEGFRSIQEIIDAPKEDLLAIEGFDEDVVTELQARAMNYQQEQQKRLEEKFAEKKGDERLKELLSNIDQEKFLALLDEDIATLNDFAELAGDELQELWGEQFPLSVANDLIMKAREMAGWFEENK